MISLFLSFLFFYHAIGLSQGEVSVADRQILIAFYEATNGEGWEDNTNWGEGDPCLSEWLGVGCSEGFEIVSIEIKKNNLDGTLPSSLTELSSLAHIDLSKNALSGDIPSFPQDSLTSVALSSNHFDGTLPSVLFSLPKLKKLHLNDNSLTGKINAKAPADNKKSPLKELDLSLNLFTGSLSSLDFELYPDLQTVSVANNSLTGKLPTSLEDLESLQIIDVSNNKLSGYVGDWVCSVSFDLSDNRFYCPLPDCCEIDTNGDEEKQAESDIQLCSSCVEYTPPSSDDTPVALIVSLCISGGVFLLLCVGAVAFYFWRRSRNNNGFTELNMNEVEMVEDLLRDSDEEAVQTIDDGSDFDYNFDTDSDCSDGIEY